MKNIFYFYWILSFWLQSMPSAGYIVLAIGNSFRQARKNYLYGGTRRRCYLYHRQFILEVAL